MGKTIEVLAKERGHEIVATIDDENFNNDTLNTADVAIEFTMPDAAAGNIERCFDADIPIVVGTTAWYKDYERLADRARREHKGLFTATNFSIGVNIVFEINRQLARIMNNFPEYEVSMTETHHTQKKDHPSGTAVTLAEGILSQLDRKNSYIGQLAEQNLAHTSFDLQIICKREDEVPGYHEVQYKSEIDEIKLSHNALNRKGFALGAIVAAEWMCGKRGVYGMKDLLKF